MNQLEESAIDKWVTREEDLNTKIGTLLVSLQKMRRFKIFSAAGSPGFSTQNQITSGGGYSAFNLYYFLFCDWKTAWTLLYMPVDDQMRKIIDEIIKVRVTFNYVYFLFFRIAMQLLSKI